MLDFCKIVHGSGSLARVPISPIVNENTVNTVNTVWYTELPYGDDLTFEHVIRNGEVSTTLGEFCAYVPTLQSFAHTV